MQPAPGHRGSGRKEAETSTDRASRSAVRPASPCPDPVRAVVLAGVSAGISRLLPSGSTSISSRRPRAHPAQHAQVTALQRMPGLGDDHRGRQRGPHRHVSVTTCTRHPAAWQIARAARAALTASMHSAASRRSTGMPRRCWPRPAAAAAPRPSMAARPAPRPPPRRSRPPRSPGPGTAPTGPRPPPAGNLRAPASPDARSAAQRPPRRAASPSPTPGSPPRGHRSAVVRRGVLR